MRKKSHIDIVRYLKNNSEFEKDINKHKLMLYFGSILPDLIPTFIYKRHRIDCTLQIVENELNKVLECKEVDGYYCRHIGIISHYLSDYYTLPHNSIYSGNLKEHIKYEEQLKRRLRQRIRENRLHSKIDLNKNITRETILNMIVEKHREYINSINNRLYNLEEDCEYIIYVNSIIIDILDYILYVNTHKQFKTAVAV